jgi:SAM-dependent methyltransferase
MSDPSPYDAIARLYDPWSRSVTEDVEFYVEQALATGGPIVELGVGTGRIAIPIAKAGVAVIGIDSSAGMLAVCAEASRAAGVEGRIDLRQGDLREPPVVERVPLVTCPFRAFLHLDTEADRLRALASAYELLRPGGLLVFDVFAPSREDIEETHGRWIEREEGIYERADWDEETRTLVLNVRGRGAEVALSLAWLSVPEWRILLAEEGFLVEGHYGWFDRTPWSGHEDSIWVCRKGG